jgi:hypothetical protein
MWSGQTASESQTGVNTATRIAMRVSAGLVVADVASSGFWLERTLRSEVNGEKRTEMRSLTRFKVARISSRVVPSSRRCQRRATIAPIIAATMTRPPTHRRRTSPYKVIAQKPETRRKLSHGSAEVQVKRATTRSKARTQGKALLRARVTLGGVATRRGDFWWTWKELRELGTVEKGAIVGGSDGSVVDMSTLGE